MLEPTEYEIAPLVVEGRPYTGIAVRFGRAWLGVAAQTVPHPPQSAGLVFVFTQMPPHSVPPFGQPQAPFVQVWPPVHTFPHAPQLSGSLFVLVHAPPQDVCCVGQPVAAQAPATQASPAPHLVPHAPQFWKLCCRFTHCVPHCVSPASHPHFPLLHT